MQHCGKVELKAGKMQMDFRKSTKRGFLLHDWSVKGRLVIEDARTFVGWGRNDGDDCDGYFEGSRSSCRTRAYSPGRCSFAVLGTKSSPAFLSRAVSEGSKTYRIWNYKAEHLFPCLFAGWVSGTFACRLVSSVSTRKERCHLCVTHVVEIGQDRNFALSSNQNQVPLSPLFPNSWAATFKSGLELPRTMLSSETERSTMGFCSCGWRDDCNTDKTGFFLKACPLQKQGATGRAPSFWRADTDPCVANCILLFELLMYFVFCCGHWSSCGCRARAVAVPLPGCSRRCSQQGPAAGRGWEEAGGARAGAHPGERRRALCVENRNTDRTGSG